MKRARLNKIRQRMEACRKRGGIGPTELESLAQDLGRVRSKRGKEPTWINEWFPELRPLSIPHHGSRDLNRFTAVGIIDQLELDLERWEQELGSKEDEESDRDE
jgi:hypothetical protein